METISQKKTTELILTAAEVALLRESITPVLGRVAKFRFLNDALRQHVAVEEANGDDPIPAVQVVVDNKNLPRIADDARYYANRLAQHAEGFMGDADPNFKAQSLEQTAQLNQLADQLSGGTSQA